MPNFQDQAYLVSDQYKDAGNLNARIQLHARFSTNLYGWFRWVFDQFDLPPMANILEIGCGSGSLWLENLPRLPGGWHFVLSDISPGMVNGCRQALNINPNNFVFEVSDASSIPFKGECFDAVIANHMLYHVIDRQRALAEITRVLKSGGYLYAATNGERHLLELDEIVGRYYQPGDYGILPGKPIRDFTLENGSAQLAPWFRQIEMRCYEDSLKVSEAEPLLAYIRSMIPHSGKYTDISQDTSIYIAIKELITKQGYIHIQKSTGLFIGRK